MAGRHSTSLLSTPRYPVAEREAVPYLVSDSSFESNDVAIPLRKGRVYSIEIEEEEDTNRPSSGTFTDIFLCKSRDSCAPRPVVVAAIVPSRDTQALSMRNQGGHTARPR